MKKFAIGLSMAALIIGGSAFAAPGSAKTGHDRNGVITRAETQTRATAMFARLDANKDGKLDQADRQLRREERKTRMFARLDANNDGQITKAEFLADNNRGERGPGKRGPGMRGDHSAMGEPGRGERGQGMHRGGRRGGHGGGMMGAGRMADANKDGATTQAEFIASALQRFDATDANKDGQVTQEERQAAREQMKAKWQQMRAQKAQG